VVGAGPTGALTALGLAQRGRDVVLLEAESEVPDSPRALAYFWHLLEGLDRLGILDDMEARGFRNSKFLNRVLETGVEAGSAPPSPAIAGKAPTFRHLDDPDLPWRDEKMRRFADDFGWIHEFDAEQALATGRR